MNSKRDNLSLGCAALAAGTSAATIKTQNILHYQIAGRSYAKAITDNIALVAVTQTPAVSLAAMALAASKTSVFFVLIDASGNIVIRQWSAGPASGTLNTVPSANDSQYQPGTFEWPAEEPNYAIIGAFKVATNASGAYTPGTTSQAAANQVVTYYNVGQDLGVPIPF